MSYLLTDPDAVLVVGGSVQRREQVRATVTDGTANNVAVVETSKQAAETLDSRDDVGCVVALTGDSETIEAVHDAARASTVGGHLPVVLSVEADDAIAAIAAERETCRYLPQSAGEEPLLTVVDSALDRYDKRRREAAESSLFTTLLGRGNFSIFAKDSQGRHIYKADLDGDVDPDTLIGKTDVDAASDQTVEMSRKTLDDDISVIETGDPIYEQEEEYHEGGEHTHWSLVTKVPWEVNGEIIGLVGFSDDINAQKRYEHRLEKQSKRIDQFISYITHDLRTPLQIAYGSIQQARTGEAGALDKVEESMDRIDEIVDDLTRLTKGDPVSRLSSNTLRTLNAQSLSTEIGSVVDEVWSVIAPEEAELIVEFPPGTVVGTEVETLRPIIENLLKNAVDHAGPDVTVRVDVSESHEIYIADDGPGIPESEHEDVLEPGYTTADDGTGTGLDIVAQTVDQQNWQLRISEATSGGARFDIDGPPIVISGSFDVEPGAPIVLEENTDVGPVSQAGHAEYDTETNRWTVTANGQNVWGNVHEFHYVYGSGDAPVRIQGRLEELDHVDEFSKAGFTIRSGVEDDAPFGYLGMTGAHGSEATWRLDSDGFTNSHQFEELSDTFPWYRVEYIDGFVTCSLSEDGEEWYAVDQREVDLGETVTVGLLVCSHSKQQTCEATFADVEAYELDED